jgi:hypothetical protein
MTFGLAIDIVLLICLFLVTSALWKFMDRTDNNFRRVKDGLSKQLSVLRRELDETDRRLDVVSDEVERFTLPPEGEITVPPGTLRSKLLILAPVSLLVGCGTISWTNAPDLDLALTRVEIWRDDVLIYGMTLNAGDVSMDPQKRVWVYIPKDWKFEKGVEYRLRARHVDAAGNVGDWSDWYEFEGNDE